MVKKIQKKLFKYKHIFLSERNTRTEKRPPRGRPSEFFHPEDYADNRNKIGRSFSKVSSVSEENRKFISDTNTYFKILLNYDIAYCLKKINKLNIIILKILQDRVAIGMVQKKDISIFLKKLKSKDFEKEFKYIKDLQVIKSEERLSEELKRISNNKKFNIEIKLLPKLGKEHYDNIIKQLSEKISSKNGQVLSSFYTDDRGALNAEVRLSKIKEISERVDTIYKIDITPTITFVISSVRKLESSFEKFKPKFPRKSTPVCIVDSGIERNHPLLVGLIDDITDYSGTGVSDNVNHGTFIAGLVGYGDVFESSARNPDVRIIMAKLFNQNREQIPEFILEQKIEEIVKKYYKKTKIFNLSFNVERCEEYISDLTQKIDNLQREYDVLFFISSGNLERHEINYFLSNGNGYPNYLDDSSCLLKVPSSGCNSVCVGSIAKKFSSSSMARIGEPSPFTRVGPACDERQKPDLVEHGGNLKYATTGGRRSSIWSNDLSLLSLNNNVSQSLFRYDIGTSFSTPLVARVGAKILDLYPSMLSDSIKALLVSSTGYNGWDKSKGHGVPSIDMALYSGENRVSYVLQSSLKTNELKRISFRVPHEMGRIRGKKRIKITLVYNPPVDNTKHVYSLVDLDFKVHKGGTQLHKKPSEKGYAPYNYQTNKRYWVAQNKIPWNNVKYGIFEWSHPGWGVNWEVHIIPRKRFLERDTVQNFSLIITLEDPSNSINIDLYNSLVNELNLRVGEMVRVF